MGSLKLQIMFQEMPRMQHFTPFTPELPRALSEPPANFRYSYHTSLGVGISAFVFDDFQFSYSRVIGIHLSVDTLSVSYDNLSMPVRPM
jgi:hypothetical protein